MALGGRSVAEWKNKITPREFQAWGEFYSHFPFDDLARYHRPAALVASSMGGSKPAELLQWLYPMPVTHEFTDADMNTLAAFGLDPKR